jgi:S-adenosylmethionine:tRNA ribosyltransferase-isomerase
MATLLDRPTFAVADALHLDPEHEAHEPPEARGTPRDEVRLLVSPGEGEPLHGRFTDLPRFLDGGDLLVVNTSGTVPAAVDGVLPGGDPVVVHVGGQLPGGLWLVEVRRPVPPATEPLVLDGAQVVRLVGGGSIDLLSPFADSQRLWLATIDTGAEPDVLALLARDGRPIRYRYVPDDWPLATYQTTFAVEPGSAEMPSAARPFTPAVVTDLVRRGVAIAPLTLHTGVSSLEGGEAPYPERYEVPASTAALVNATRASGGHVVAVGTTVVRALETVVDEGGTVHPGHGWTEALITPEHPVRSVDGLLTGWHEPAATHLLMLEAIASTTALRRAYRAALDGGYRWHEFGDSHLILPYRA